MGIMKKTKRRILEICDHEAIREFVTGVCVGQGFEVLQASCGDEALKLYRKHGPQNPLPGGDLSVTAIFRQL
jgi:CheY-like chemotaxis protein